MSAMMLRSQTEDPNVSRDFLRACHSGDVDKVETLVEKHGIRDWSVFRHTASGDTALHVAAREGNMNIVRYLCERFNDLPVSFPMRFKVNVFNKDIKKPLHEAAQFAREDILKYLLSKGAPVDVIKRGDWTPLMLACTKSGLAARHCIRALLAANANTRLRNKDGWTPLLIACRTGDELVIETLLKHLPESINDRSNNGRTALHIAAFHGHVGVISLLYTSSECTNANLLNAQDSSGSSPFHEAVKHGNLVTVKMMIRLLGADVNLVDNVGQTILHVAALTGNVEIVQYILENNLIDVNYEASFGITPLIIAQRHNHSDVIKILVKYGAK